MSEERVQIHRLSSPIRMRDALTADIRDGFSRSPKELPPKYFYDLDGSGIFEQITGLPEYYVTRAETAALEMAASEILAAGKWDRIVELGSGSSRKTRLLLSAVLENGKSPTYIPFDISESAICDAAEALAKDYDELTVSGYVGDFLTNDLLAALDGHEPKLIAFLGGTLGNLTGAQRAEFYSRLSRGLGPKDALLVGVDLVKDASIIEPAYNDASGTTATFNKNVLRVIQNELGGSIDLSNFRHHAPYLTEEERIEMRLYAECDLEISFPSGLLPTYQLDKGEYILTEISQKFTRRSLTKELAGSALEISGFWTDPQDLVALVLLCAAA